MTSAALSAEASGPPQPVNWPRLLLGFSGMAAGNFLSILDIQIVTASLPQIQAGIGASADEVTWVQTAYLIPEVVMIPLSGFLARTWGTQKVFLASCFGFLVMSVACGFATSLESMIVARALQGFIGGAMVPTAFAVAFTAFPPERRVTASVTMGLIATLAPTIGPTLGGLIAEAMGWRWLFFINLFPGAIVLFLVARYGDFDRGDPSLAARFDWPSLGLMATALMTLQFVLEEGAAENWFEDPLIAALFAIGLLSGAVFVRRSLRLETPIVELRAMGDRNFLIGLGMTFTAGLALYGGSFLLPFFLGSVRGFSPLQIGATMAISGATMFASGPLVGRIVRSVDLRVGMGIGFLMCAFSMWLSHVVTPVWGFAEFAGMQIIRGVGVMMAMIATQQLTMRSLAPDMVKNASGLVNLSRNVGGAFGLAALSTVLTHQTAAHMAAISAALPQGAWRAESLVSGMAARMGETGVADPHAAALKSLTGLVAQQASARAFGDAFLLLGVACLLAAILAQFARPGPAVPGTS